MRLAFTDSSAVAPPRSPEERKERASWWANGWSRWGADPAAPPAPPAPPTPPPEPEQHAAAAHSPASQPEPTAPRRHNRHDPLTLLEWHDSPIPVKLTAARAALQPSLAIIKELSGGEGGSGPQLSGRLDIELPTCRTKLNFCCKEAVLGGTLTATLPSAKLEFRRRFKLPNGTVLALGAGVAAETVGSGSRRRRRLKPFLGCQLQLDHGGGGSDEVVVSDRGFSDTHRFKLPSRLGGRDMPNAEVEVSSTLTLPPGLAGLASAASLSSLGSAASLQGLAGSLPSSPSLPGMGGLPAGLPSLPSFPSPSSSGGLPQLPQLNGGLPPAPSMPQLHDLPQLSGGLPQMPSLPRLPSLQQLGSGLHAVGAAGDEAQEGPQGLQFHIERVALVLRI